MRTLEQFQNEIKAIMEGKDLPYRNRVEVFAVKDDKVYGGFYPDGTFGVFGGGTDGESLETAAEREYKEESGYSLIGLEKLDIPALEVSWKSTPKNDKQEERQNKYKGTRTWYFYAELGTKGKKAKGDDGASSLSDIKLHDIDKALKALDKEGGDESIKSQINNRKKALKLIQDRFSEKDELKEYVNPKYPSDVKRSEIKKSLSWYYSGLFGDL